MHVMNVFRYRALSNEMQRNLQMNKNRSSGPDTFSLLTAPFRGQTCSCDQRTLLQREGVLVARLTAPNWKVIGLIPTVAGTISYSICQTLNTYLLANCGALWTHAENGYVVHRSPRGCDMFPAANIACRDCPTIWTMGPVLKGR